MKKNLIVREEIFNIIQNQIEINEPPETKIVYSRLLKMGYDEIDVKKMIGQCLAIELFDILKYKKTFDRSRYIQNLNLLPKLPL